VLYHDLNLPLSNFIRALVHSDLTALVVKGTPTTEATVDAWASIYSQWLDTSYESETIYVLQLQSEVVLLTSHVSEVETCLYFLATTYHEGLLGVLRNNGYQLPEDFDNELEWLNGLQRIHNQLAMRKQALAGKVKEYDAYVAAHAKDEVTEKYFTTTLLRLAKYQGVAIIRSADITTAEFVSLLQDYIAYNKSRAGEGEEDGE
jgi:hypothetical protein